MGRPRALHHRLAIEIFNQPPRSEAVVYRSGLFSLIQGSALILQRCLDR